MDAERQGNPIVAELRKLIVSAELTAGGPVVGLDGEKIKLGCAASGWSLVDLAKRSKVSYPTVKAVVRGQRVRPRTAFRLVASLYASQEVRASC